MNNYFFKSSCLLALMSVSKIFAQEEQTLKSHNVRVVFDFGVNAPGCNMNRPERIRQNYDSKESFSLSTSYIGVKSEIFIFRNRLGIAPGVRFVSATSSITSGNDNFLWKMREDGWNTDYVKINKIRQQVHLLSIPLEMRFFLNDRDLPFQTYVKVATSLNYRFRSKDAVIDFTNAMMEKFSKEVLAQIPKGNTFSSFFYCALGFKIGRFMEGSRSSWVNFEFQYPYMLLTDNSFAFVNKKNKCSGVGIQLSFDFPIGKVVPIGSK